MAERFVFRDAAGRELTTGDLADFTGDVGWEIVGSGSVPAEAVQLHQEARLAGTRGEFHRALVFLDRARALAPDWPYPAYDAAFTYLLQGDTEAAEELYAEVDRMAPRGFFTCKTTLDSLRQEHAGALPAGFSKAFTNLEWLDNAAEKKAVLESMVQEYPAFGPAWKELSALLDNADDRLHAITRGLEADPDPETRGILLINRALILEQRGQRAEAIAILGELALDPASTLGTETLAKATLAQIVEM
jgi:tetratricopeptide (TPR) repeat protein